MGRWCQAKRRSSSGPGALALGPPTAPFLSILEDYLVGDASVPTNVGGASRLYWKDGGVGDWELAEERDWALHHEWLGIGEAPGSWFYQTDVGNGVDYTGESPPSNVIIL